MKIFIQDIDLKMGFAPRDYMVVKVSCNDENEHLNQSAIVSVYIDKTVTDIIEIEKIAIEKAKAFLSKVLAG